MPPAGLYFTAGRPSRPSAVTGARRLLTSIGRVGVLAASIALLLVVGAVGVGIHGSNGPGRSAVRPTAATTPTTPTTTPAPAALCPGLLGSPSAFLAQAVFGAPAHFTASAADPGSGLLSIDQMADLSDQSSSGEYAYLQIDDFVEASRSVFLDATDGLQADVRVYQFGCAAAATQYIATADADQMSMTAPVNIDTSAMSGAVGFASAGPDPDGQFDDAVAATVGPYYAVVYLSGAQPTNGAYAVTLLQSQVARLDQLARAGTATTAAAPAPGPATPIKEQPGQPPICPAPTGSLTLGQVNQLMPGTPHGFFPLSDSDAPAGPVSLSELSSSGAVPALAAAANRSEGFEGGYRRVWEEQNGEGQLQVELDQFTCAAGANFFAGVAVGSPPGTTPFDVTDGIVGATGFTSNAPDSFGNYRQAIVASVGDTGMVVIFFSRSTSTSTIEQLATTVAQHLQNPTAA
jgi:hypothetical protein